MLYLSLLYAMNLCLFKYSETAGWTSDCECPTFADIANGQVKDKKKCDNTLSYAHENDKIKSDIVSTVALKSMSTSTFYTDYTITMILTKIKDLHYKRLGIIFRSPKCALFLRDSPQRKDLIAKLLSEKQDIVIASLLKQTDYDINNDFRTTSRLPYCGDLWMYTNLNSLNVLMVFKNMDLSDKECFEIFNVILLKKKEYNADDYPAFVFQILKTIDLGTAAGQFIASELTLNSVQNALELVDIVNPILLANLQSAYAFNPTVQWKQITLFNLLKSTDVQWEDTPIGKISKIGRALKLVPITAIYNFLKLADVSNKILLRNLDEFYKSWFSEFAQVSKQHDFQKMDILAGFALKSPASAYFAMLNLLLSNTLARADMSDKEKNLGFYILLIQFPSTFESSRYDASKNKQLLEGLYRTAIHRRFGDHICWYTRLDEALQSNVISRRYINPIRGFCSNRQYDSVLEKAKAAIEELDNLTEQERDAKRRKVGN